MSRQFDDDALRAAYEPAITDSTTTHGPDCPTETQLLSAVRGEGNDAERLRTLDRALRCAACRREMALLHAVSSTEVRPAARAVERRSWAGWMPAALAASLVLAVGLAGVVWSRNGGDEDVTRTELATGPVLVTPASGAAVRTGLVRFVWRPIAGVIHYTVEVDATDGTVLMSSQTRDTTLTAPIAATAVGENRWLVRAKLQDGSEKRSDTWRLRVE